MDELIDLAVSALVPLLFLLREKQRSGLSFSFVAIWGVSFDPRLSLGKSKPAAVLASWERLAGSLSEEERPPDPRSSANGALWFPTGEVLRAFQNTGDKLRVLDLVSPSSFFLFSWKRWLKSQREDINECVCVCDGRLLSL